MLFRSPARLDDSEHRPEFGGRVDFHFGWWLLVYHESVEFGRTVRRQVTVRLRPIAERDQNFPHIVFRDRMPRLATEPAVNIGGAQLREAATGIRCRKPTELPANVCDVIRMNAHRLPTFGKVVDQLRQRFGDDIGGVAVIPLNPGQLRC